MDGLEIGNRMKEFYENVPRTRLMRRCPVALRMDGKAFKHFTENFKKPKKASRGSAPCFLYFVTRPFPPADPHSEYTGNPQSSRRNCSAFSVR